MIKILIVDDQPAVRKGLRMQLSLEDDLEVVGEAENGNEAVKAVPELNPDLIILDLEMPIIDGFNTMEILNERHPGLPVIALSIHDNIENRRKAQLKGVNAFVLKSGDTSELIAKIHQAVYK